VARAEISAWTTPTLPAASGKAGDMRLSLRRAITSQAYGAVKRAARAAASCSKFYDRVTFDDRRTECSVLVAVLAGYKQDLWSLVMPSLKTAVAALDGADIYIVSPGKTDQALADLCRSEGWSYLATATNDVSLAQTSVSSSMTKPN
jgi:hypothetical protein